MFGGSRTCLKEFPRSNVLVSIIEFLSIKFAASFSQQSEMVIVKCPIQGPKNITRVWIESRPRDYFHCKNYSFTLSKMLLTKRKYVTHFDNSTNFLFIQYITHCTLAQLGTNNVCKIRSGRRRANKTNLAIHFHFSGLLSEVCTQ